MIHSSLPRADRTDDPPEVLAERLRVLFVSPMVPSPPRSGAQARTHGLLTALSKRHDLTAVVLYDDDEIPYGSEAAMRAYCRAVTFVANPNKSTGWKRRLLQIKSWLSPRSYQSLLFDVPKLRAVVAHALDNERFDVVFVNFPFLANDVLEQVRTAASNPVLVIDSHDVSYHLAQQIAESGVNFGQRLHARFNWRKLAHEELAAYAAANGVGVCSTADQERIAEDAPPATTAVIPNAADVDYFRPRDTDPSPDDRTVLYFGLLSTVPNSDGVLYFLNDVWPLICKEKPDTRFVVVGAEPTRALLSQASPSVEVVGPVDDLRPYLSAASVVVVPLRLGSGTRLKILETWAMARPVVSTELGAEGLRGVPGEHLLVADSPSDFASAVLSVLNDPKLGEKLGRAGRLLAEGDYSWSKAAQSLEGFFNQLLERRNAAPSSGGVGETH